MCSKCDLLVPISVFNRSVEKEAERFRLRDNNRHGLGGRPEKFDVPFPIRTRSLQSVPFGTSGRRSVFSSRMLFPHRFYAGWFAGS